MIRLPRNAQIWLPGYWRSRRQARRRPPPKRLWVALTDHFEPFWAKADEAQARRRVEMWRRLWPEIASRHNDDLGRPPRYSFFYPEEEYRPDLLELLAELARMGVADVEVHLHHDGESEQAFLDRMRRFIVLLHERHGLLRRRGERIVFGFIHGNWALDNSHPDGRYCGLNNEITLLRDLGCYADFTMPSAPSPTQARMVNCIYWAVDDPERPKSYDIGIPVQVGAGQAGDLLMIPGPLGLRWDDRLAPRLEKGELAAHVPLTRRRARSWLALAPRVGEDAFLKLFAHGAKETNAAALLQGGLDQALQWLREECSQRGVQLRFASAWEMFQAIEALLQPAGSPAQAPSPSVPC